MTLPEVAQAWFRRGAMETLAGIDCFVIDRPAVATDHAPAAAGSSTSPDRKPPGHTETATLWLHGFPSSSLDWRGVVERLAWSGRTLLMDFPGFGFSAKPDNYSYSLIDQADRIVLLLRSRGIRRVRLVCHDMGTSVVCELLARREMGLLPFSIDGVVFMNGSIFIEQARLTPSQKLLRSRLAGLYTRVASEAMFRWQIKKILGTAIPPSELEAMWALMQHNDGIARLPRIIHYIDQRYRYYPRWTDPLARLDIPVLVLWGQRDPVAVAAIGQRLAETIPGATTCRLDSIGHFPMLEAPAQTAGAVEDWLSARDPGAQSPGDVKY
ncbi:MAG: alpha/beta hydrolase [Wenzhouxiangellaceae bacterium]|nr:alpha/beta hydrolase [Wenzhouxiangellaceae bacterium]